MNQSIKRLLNHPKALSTDECELFMKNNPGYLGTFPKDELPIKLSTHQSCIINLDNHDGPGTHWVAVYCGNDYCEYFDSYGIIPPTIIRRFMRTSKKKMIYSTTEIQPLRNDSILCGYYCIYYIVMRAKGVEPYDVLYKFEINNELSNDKLLIRELKKIYNSTIH